MEYGDRLGRDLRAAPPGRARTAGRMGALGDWGIENRLYYVRDVTYEENHSQVRVGVAPRVTASLGNLALNLYQLVGVANIVQATDHIARDRRRTHQLIGITPWTATLSQPCVSPRNGCRVS